MEELLKNQQKNEQQMRQKDSEIDKYKEVVQRKDVEFGALSEELKERELELEHVKQE